MLTVYQAESTDSPDGLTVMEIAERLNYTQARVRMALVHYQSFYKKYFSRKKIKAKTKMKYKYKLTDFGREILKKYRKCKRLRKPLKLKSAAPTAFLRQRR